MYGTNSIVNQVRGDYMIYTKEKNKIIPDDMKLNIDTIMNEQLLNANRRYAEANNNIVANMEALSKALPSAFLSELKKRWNWHNHFYEDLLEPAYTELTKNKLLELSPKHLDLLIDVYETMLKVDEATLIASAAIKRHLNYQLPYMLEIANEKSKSTRNEFMLLTPPTPSFYSQYQYDHLAYIIFERMDKNKGEKYKDYLLKKYHGNVELVFEGRFKEFERFLSKSDDEILENMSHYQIDEYYKMEHRIFTSCSDEIKAYTDIIKYDNVDEKFIASSLIGISGFLFRKQILKYLNDSGIIENKGFIYEFSDDEILEALNKLKKERKKKMDKNVRPYKQKGDTCAIVCMMMILEYYGIIEKADWQKERMYYRGFRSRCLPGTPFAALAWFMANSGLDVNIIHSSKNIFDNPNEFVPKSTFNSAMKEYNDYLKQADEVGANIQNGIDFDADFLKKQLENDNLVMLAGQHGVALHAILLTGYDEEGFIVCDPLRKQKQKLTKEGLEKFMDTPLGKWCISVNKQKERTDDLLQETDSYKENAEIMTSIIPEDTKTLQITKQNGRVI